MRLAELEPRWMKRTADDHWHEVDSLKEADGLMFLCPKCFGANGGRAGTHQVICWNPSVPQTTSPKPGRWELIGTNFDDLSLRAGSSSVLLTGGCNAHFHITNGAVTD